MSSLRSMRQSSVDKENERALNSSSKMRSTRVKNTTFNPFGKYKVCVESHKTMFEEAVEKLVKAQKTDDQTTDSSRCSKQKTEVKQMISEFKKLMGTVRQMSKSNPTAIPCTLSCFVMPLSRLCEEFETNLNSVRSGEIMQISQYISEFINLISLYCTDSCGAELLEEWAPLFERILMSNLSSLRNCGITLWKASFGKVKGRLRYPDGKLREILIGLPKKYSLVIPSPESEITNHMNDAVFHSDDDEVAMDGLMEIKTEGKRKEVNCEESLTFELSQQPELDDLAEKLIGEKKTNSKKAESPSRKVRKVKKKGNSEKLLLDEDSKDFVIIKTATSSRKKTQLTDRQKQKFEESREPVNYVNEESQSGTQKETALKKALTSFNFDIEDSRDSMKGENEVTKNPLEESNKSTKRQRRLFESDSENDKTPKKRSNRIELSDECLAANNDDDVIILPKFGGEEIVEIGSEKSRNHKKQVEEKEKTEQLQKLEEPMGVLGPSDEVEEVIDTPHTPSTRKILNPVTTPSILRRPPTEGTPVTERKRNRVHFDAEKEKLETIPVEMKDLEGSNSLPQMDYDTETEILYPSLKDCEESVDVLARRLVPLSGAVSCMSILKKSFAQAGVKTIGQFSALTVKQVAKLNGIRSIREKTARKVLSDYEANEKKSQKMAFKSDESTQELIRIPENLSPLKSSPKKKLESPMKEIQEPNTLVLEEFEKENVEKINDKVVVLGNVEKKCTDENIETNDMKEEIKNEPVEDEILKDSLLLDEISRRIARNLARNGTENATIIDDTLFDTFIRLRGMIRERGFKNV